MNRNIWFFTTLTFIWCVATVLPVAAQQKVSVRTMALSEIKADPLFFATQGDEKWVPVAWSQRQPSKPTETFAQEGILPLFSMEMDTDDKSAYKASHQIKIPSGAKEILLFAWMSEGKLRMHALADDFLGKKHNHWLLINLASKDIAFKVGDKTKPTFLKSNQSKIYIIDVQENEPATILGQARIKGTEPKLFYSSYFPVKKGRRTIVLFTDDGEKIRTKLIADHFLREEKPEE